MAIVVAPLPLGDQEFDPLADQLTARVAEHRLGLRIDLDDYTLPVHGNDHVGDSLQHGG